MDDRIFKNLLLTKFNFENFEIHEILNKIRKDLFVCFTMCLKRKCLQMRILLRSPLKA